MADESVDMASRTHERNPGEIDTVEDKRWMTPDNTKTHTCNRSLKRTFDLIPYLCRFWSSHPDRLDIIKTVVLEDIPITLI